MFKSLFRKKIEIPSHDENWQVYFSRINNQKASVIVDLNVADIAPVKDLPFVFYLIVPYDSAGEDGLPTMESFKLINEVEDKIAELKDKYTKNLLHVATISMNAERLQMYYCHRISDTEAFLHQVDIAFGERLTYQTDYREDLKWDDFYDLAYPLPFQLEMIKNRSVVKMLIEAGDSLSKARPIHHYLNFVAEKDVADFLEFAEKEGFAIQSKEKEQDGWKVSISRSDYISYEHIDDLCLPLWEKAEAHNGHYDGWESQVISN